MTAVTPTQVYTQGTGTTSTDPFITVFSTVNPGQNSINYKIGKRWVNTTTNSEWILASLDSFNGNVTANWIELTGTGFPVPLPVIDGGTGDISFIPYTPICGGTTSTNPLQSVASIGTAGQVLVSNGAGELPTFKSISGAQFNVNVQTFLSDGSFTYTPSVGLKACIIEVLGAGGGSGAVSQNASTFSIGGAGGAGGYAKGLFTSAEIGASQTVTVGTGGSGGSGSGGPGGTGGTSSVGTLISATGGSGGTGGLDSTTLLSVLGATGGTGSGGDINVQGQFGGAGFGSDNGTISSIFTGSGGSTIYGAGALSQVANSHSTLLNGASATGYGSGASGSISTIGQAGAATGGRGAQGAVIITEFIL